MDYENEEWRDILGYEGLYQVSNLGRIKSLSRYVVRRRGNNYTAKERIMKPGSSVGYWSIILVKDGKKKRRKVHGLVCEAFIGKRPDGMQCNHINGNRKDNQIKNLEYCTRSENLIHAYRTLGKSHDPKNIPRGENHKRAILTERDVLDIRRICDGGGYRPKELGERYGVHPSLIYRINKKLIWRHLL